MATEAGGKQSAPSASSRITVVCAECKRLKLKCDRRTPCGSCIKRDTVARCQYSPAAAEKIDVQSLHNRLLQLEGMVTQLSSGKMKIVGDTNNDRTLLATSATGSSILLSVDDIATVWLEQLEIKDSDLRVVDLEMRIDTSHTERSSGDIYPPIQAFLASDTGMASVGVTPTLLALLPPDGYRDSLLNQLEFTMTMHPSFNFPRFRDRIMALFSGDLKENPPTLSFFASAAAGFALGAQAWFESNHVPENEKAGHALDSDRLWALSRQSLAMFELHCQHDLDFIFASLMQCLYLLHDGKPRLSHTLYPTLGKLVNVARVMGLNVDPDEHNKHSLFDAEMRRRAWWDLYYYDLFISDLLGQDPTIHDASHTTRLPADVDEDNFNPSSSVLPPPREYSNFAYFAQKCKLAQLIKSMKKRTFREAGSSEPSLEAAMAFETEIATWLSELPATFKYKSEGSADLLNSPHALIAQRCELVTLANALVLKLYTPFLKKSSAPLRHHVSDACTNAAHIIISASVTMLQVYKHSRPASFLFYPFGRQVFSAAVVVARVVIQAPQTIYAKVALKDLQSAIDVLKDPLVATSRGPLRGGVEGTPSEALRIVTLLLDKAETSMMDESSSSGSKRKHVEVGEHLTPGLHIPFISGSVEFLPEEKSVAPPVTSVGPPPPQSRSRHILGLRPSSNAPATWAPPAPAAPSNPTPAPREPQVKEKARSNYPSIGIRVRHAKTTGARPTSSESAVPRPPAAQLPQQSSSHLPPPPPPQSQPPPQAQPPVKSHAAPSRPPPPQRQASGSHMEPGIYSHGSSAHPLDSMPSTPMHEDFPPYMHDQPMHTSTTPYLVSSHASSTHSLFEASFANPPGTSSSAPSQSFIFDPSSLAMLSSTPSSGGPSGVAGMGSSRASPATVNPHALQQQQQPPQSQPQQQQHASAHLQSQRSRYGAPISNDRGMSGSNGVMKTDVDAMSGLTMGIGGSMHQQQPQDPQRRIDQSHDPSNPSPRGFEHHWEPYGY